MNLPVELIQHILSFLNPCEVVRLRQVSKRIRDITHNSGLWREIYANVRLLRPLGPVSSESTQSLERDLVRSELVAKTWTSQPLKQHSRALTTWRREKITSWTVVFGRWCIFRQGKIFRCHDIETDTRHFLYDATADPEFRFMVRATATGVTGKRVYLLLVDRTYLPKFIKLVEFSVDNDSFSEPEIINWFHLESHLLNSWLMTDDIHGSAPFLVVQRSQPCMVLDLHTRCLYKLPVPKHTIDLANELQSSLPEYERKLFTQVVLTRTHVMAVHVYGRSSHGLVRAFVVPESAILPDRTEFGELRLTHKLEVAIPTYYPMFSLLRNSIVDPVTGSVNIKLLRVTPNTQIGGGQKDMSCLDLTLPGPISTNDVLLISIRSQHLLESACTSVWYTASDDGYIRGLLLTESGPSIFLDTSVRKFSIDASKEECIMAVSDSCPHDWPEAPGNVVFDGARGRIHYFQLGNEVKVVKVDLA
ncbi:hypothetical protein OG21DRAFT_1497068 [Imleria badia]|nr:hypothetical protein OG21DRAFT_1497068 [Imleria badia]